HRNTHDSPPIPSRATRKCRRPNITLRLILTCANDMHCGQCFAELMVNAMAHFCKSAGLSRRFFRILGYLGVMAVVAMTIGETFAQPPGPDSNFERCRAITDDAARLHCYE